VFSNSVFDATAPTRAIRGSRKGPGDLVLIKLAAPAPKPWRPQMLDMNLLGAVLPPGAARGDLTELLGYPTLVSYGFGDSEDNFDSYSSGTLRRTTVQVSSSINERTPQFYTKAKDKLGGTCNGDSGGAALFGVPTETAQQVVVGILSENSVPCTGSAGRYVNPDAFRDFIVRESAALGSPVKVPSKDQWTNFLSQPGATGSG